MDEPDRRSRFEAVVLPHLPAAYNLARWLTRDDHDAEDVVQEAYLRAYRHFGGFRGDDGRAWVLGVVRNTCLTWLAKNRHPEPTTPFDDARHGPPADAPGPDSPLLRAESRATLHRALAQIPPEYREVLVLRELEGLSYKDIATVTGSPIGTVMSRLARGRGRLREQLTGRRPEDV